MKLLWLAAYWGALVWSAIRPQDYFTWFLEALPALIVFVILAATYRRFRLTTLAYTLILLHCLILFLGAHYTYAEVDTFKFVRDFFGWQRNNYDKVGHFAQGFVPAIVAREVLIRHRAVSGRAWLNLFVISICWPSARSTNCSNGALRWPPAIPPRAFSAPRAICGTPNPTWRWRCWALVLR